MRQKQFNNFNDYDADVKNAAKNIKINEEILMEVEFNRGRLHELKLLRKFLEKKHREGTTQISIAELIDYLEEKTGDVSLNIDSIRGMF